jgi:hypothetical protein
MSHSGDSGVGKTSFIQRFCSDTFKEIFAATIGVDLQVKMLNIDNRIIALQLWDTVRKILYLFLIVYSILFSRLVKKGLISYTKFLC